MKIKATIRKVVKEDKLKAFVNFTVENDFLVTNARLLMGKNGLYVAMPQRRRMDGSYEDICFPITRELSEEMRNTVIKAYEEALQKQEQKDCEIDKEK